MLKAEIKKLLKCHRFYVLLVILTSSFIYSCIDYYNNFGYVNVYSGYSIFKYNSIEDVNNFIIDEKNTLNEYEEFLNNNELSSSERKNIEECISSSKIKIKVYQYIIDNNISYSDYKDFSGTCSIAGDSAFSALAWIYFNHIAIVIPFIVSLLASFLITNDFHKGVYKFLYSTNISRNQIIKRRYLLLIIFTLFIVIVSSIVSLIISFNYGSGNGYIIYANNSIVFRLNYFTFWLTETLDILFRSLTVGTFIFGISLICKYSYIPLFLSIVTTIINKFVFSYDNSFLSMILSGLSRVYATPNAYTWNIVIYILLFLIVSIASFSFGIFRFNKKDLN